MYFTNSYCEPYLHKLLVLLNPSPDDYIFVIVIGNGGFPEAVDVICVCGYCAYTPTLGRQQGTSVILSLADFRDIMKFKVILKRFFFVSAFFKNEILQRPSVQSTVAMRQPDAYWRNVLLYGEFVLSRLESKMKALFSLKSTKANRLAMYAYFKLLDKVRTLIFLLL